MINLERFRQSSPLMKIPNTLFRRALQMNEAGPLLGLTEATLCYNSKLSLDVTTKQSKQRAYK